MSWIIHGHARAGAISPEFTSWAGMMGRCTVPTNGSYHNYGARGITVCERWQSFANFLADMGLRPHGAQLDRIDNAGNYEPGNCRWASRKEQAANRRSTRFIEFRGCRLPVGAAAEMIGVARQVIYRRAKDRGETYQQSFNHFAVRANA